MHFGTFAITTGLIFPGFSVETVHRRRSPFRQNHVHCFRGLVQHFVDPFELRLSKRLQDSLLRRDPQPDPQEFLCSKGTDDGLHAIVPGRTASFA